MRPKPEAKRVTRLSSKFQISIPKAVREAQRWEAGQKFAFVSKGSEVRLVPVPTLDQLAGIALGANTDHYRDDDDHN